MVCTPQVGAESHGLTPPEVAWPQMSSRQRLLGLYLSHVHPFIPMLSDFSFISGIDFARNVPAEFLTLAIFATASLYDNAGVTQVSNHAGTSVRVKDSYFEDANRLFGMSRESSSFLGFMILYSP